MARKEVAPMSADIDPSLRAAEPPSDSLDDGFSPPPPARRQPVPAAAHEPAAPEAALGEQSPF
jgi:hypothetical protein